MNLNVEELKVHVDVYEINEIIPGVNVMLLWIKIPGDFFKRSKIRITNDIRNLLNVTIRR